MHSFIIVKANIKKYRGNLFGLCILIFMISVALCTVMTVWANSHKYIADEIKRIGFGDFTAWVSGVESIHSLEDELTVLPEIKQINSQQIIFSNYTILNQKSDSEGQFIIYNSEQADYHFFNQNLDGYNNASKQISSGEIYVSASLISIFGVQIGDEVELSVARNGGKLTFVIRGFFEDPYMGSSMIGMKSFLICQEDFEHIVSIIEQSGIDALARNGAMLHIFQNDSENFSNADLNSLLNSQTSFSEYVEFTYSAQTMIGFMLLLQNIFSGMLLTFVIILLVASTVVLAHILQSSIEQEASNLGILKTFGFTNWQLQKIQIVQYLIPIGFGIFTGLIFSFLASKIVCNMTLTTTGILIPATVPIIMCMTAFLIIICFYTGFILIEVSKIGGISPMAAIRKSEIQKWKTHITHTPIHAKNLSLWITLRQLFAERKKYIGICTISLLLVFFTSAVGRIDTWLGTDGKGLMDAFNPADHDIGVQSFSEQVSLEEIENLISEFTSIYDSYELAMPNVALNGIDYTANVITEPERFHILKGKTCINDDEIVITEFLAADMGISIGDTVKLSVGNNHAEYKVTGIYQCANDMGANFGLSREGYLKIGGDDFRIWCTHYFLEDSSQKIAVIEALEQSYGANIHVHENAWPGLYGILTAMHLLTIFLYATVAIFVLVVVILTGSKLLSAEQKDIAIYKSLGFTDRSLRLAFSLRFGLTSAVGAAIGILFSCLFTDSIVDIVMKMCGISDFVSNPEMLIVLFPAIVVIVFFIGFAYLSSVRIRKVDFTDLAVQ